MIVLGLDTSAYANAVGLAEGDRVLADAVFPGRDRLAGADRGQHRFGTE